MHDSYAIGSVSGRYDVGGLVGRNVGDIKTTYAVGRVTGAAKSAAWSDGNSVRLRRASIIRKRPGNPIRAKVNRGLHQK